MIIWITGISASGKTTLARALIKKFKPSVPEMCLIDGDEIRALFENDLDYDEAGRTEQIKRIQKLAKILDEQKLCVVVAALYSHPELLEWNKENFSEYHEVYLNAPLSIVRERDPKGLYAKADAGKMECVVGLDVPWHEPINSTLQIDVTESSILEEMVKEVASVVPRLSLLSTKPSQSKAVA
jgi:cytidine diphosphoramidate kinase